MDMDMENLSLLWNDQGCKSMNFSEGIKACVSGVIGERRLHLKLHLPQ